MIFTLIQKEFILEWRQRYAINGIILYLASTVFICYMSFNLKLGLVDPIIWNALFWVIILFTAVNAVAKSFLQESYGRTLYYFSLVKPESFIISKTIYYSGLLLLMSILGFLFYAFVMGNPVQDKFMYLLVLCLGSIGLSSTLTLTSAIASKASNSSSLMAVLSFPIIIPLLLVLIKASKNAMDGLDRSVYTDQLLTLVAINALIMGFSYLLFPYLWRS